MVIEPQGDQAVETVKGVAADGSPISMKATGSPTGGEAKFLEGGPPTGTSVVTAKRKENDRFIDVTTMRDGKVLGTQHSVVSDDGKTMTSTSKNIDAQGKASKTVEVFGRQ
jgi:hypothetical protein